MSTTITTYNVNGIRASITKGLLNWVDSHSPEILCLQEIKATEADIPVQEFHDRGYHCYWQSAEKKGYSGVAILSKLKPQELIIGCGNPLYDVEGRFITAVFPTFTLINIYFPSGSASEDRHQFKMEFLAFLGPWIQAMKETYKNVILVGDYNIVHTRLDIHNPDRKDNPSGYRPEERQWMTDWLAEGFCDAYRHKHPEDKVYSWWSFRAGSRPKNLGWRIDYQCVTKDLIDKIEHVEHFTEVKFSDHCPVSVMYNI